MKGFYDRNAFDSELWGMKPLMDEIVATGDEIRSCLEERLVDRGLSGDIRLVGSTNPQRLTCVVDPRNPDEKSSADFDVKIIVPFVYSDVKRRNLLEDIIPEGLTVTNHERIDRRTYFGKYPVEISLVAETEINDCPAIQYDSSVGSFTPDEVMQIRGLKLFFMRAGLYGGFTGGMKGIAVEQLIRKYGDYPTALEKIYEKLVSDLPLSVRDPVDNSDLTRNVQRDILHRMKKYSKVFHADWKLPCSPYSFSSWEGDHGGQTNLSLLSSYQEPHQLYQDVLKYGNRALESLKRSDCAALILPSYKQTNIFVSFGRLNSSDSQRVQRSFLGRWNKAQAEHRTHCSSL
jgi:hypothetical protein